MAGSILFTPNAVIFDPDPDPLVRGMDPQIQIQIHTKMPWIRNTGNPEYGTGNFALIFALQTKILVMFQLKVRHITSGRGVVAGSILFTPNAVIFDPDPSDPLGKRVFHQQKGFLGVL